MQNMPSLYSASLTPHLLSQHKLLQTPTDKPNTLYRLYMLGEQLSHQIIHLATFSLPILSKLKPNKSTRTSQYEIIVNVFYKLPHQLSPRQGGAVLSERLIERGMCFIMFAFLYKD